MQCGLDRMVISESALATDERVIFLAKNALTDAKFDGSCHRISDFPVRFPKPYCSGSRGSANDFSPSSKPSATACRTARGSLRDRPQLRRDQQQQCALVGKCGQ